MKARPVWDYPFQVNENLTKNQSRFLSIRQGNRVSTVSDELTIPIGGERDDDDATATTAKKKKKTGPRPANNRIKSTKYTVITFLPQNLLEQFRRIANFYFLVMVIISTVIGESSGYTQTFSIGMPARCLVFGKWTPSSSITTRHGRSQ